MPEASSLVVAMIGKSLVAIVVAVVVLTGCERVPEDSTPHVIQQIDGCTVYTFVRDQRDHYFTRCPHLSDDHGVVAEWPTGKPRGSFRNPSRPTSVPDHLPMVVSPLLVLRPLTYAHGLLAVRL